MNYVYYTRAFRQNLKTNDFFWLCDVIDTIESNSNLDFSANSKSNMLQGALGEIFNEKVKGTKSCKTK
jgi:hypothetical protein